MKLEKSKDFYLEFPVFPLGGLVTPERTSSSFKRASSSAKEALLNEALKIRLGTIIIYRHNIKTIIQIRTIDFVSHIPSEPHAYVLKLQPLHQATVARISH